LQGGGRRFDPGQLHQVIVALDPSGGPSVTAAARERRPFW